MIAGESFRLFVAHPVITSWTADPHCNPHDGPIRRLTAPCPWRDRTGYALCSAADVQSQDVRDKARHNGTEKHVSHTASQPSQLSTPAAVSRHMGLQS